MKIKLQRIEKDFIYTHLIFIIICIIILLIPFSIGIRLFALIIIYNILVSVVGKIRKHSNWFNLWIYVSLLSLFQIFPDWFLSAQLNILVFPEDGLFKIGTVSGYMLGLWVIPLFIIIFIGLRSMEKYSKRTTYFIISLLSLLIFGFAEATMWMLPSWYPQNVTTILGHVALYIIVPEILFGLVSYYLFIKTKDTNYLKYIGVAFLIMLLYLGSASFFYFFIEKVILL
ncbi:MAG: DUF6989 domain-containing protein [Promethearchaeota archaeon]|jgi:hypothetical protein